MSNFFFFRKTTVHKKNLSFAEDWKNSSKRRFNRVVSEHFFKILEVFLKLLLCARSFCTCALRFGTPTLFCFLKRHHTYDGVNTFVCSYSLNPNPSHSLILSSLLDWQPYLLCGFPGFVTLLERRVRVPEPRDRSSTHRSTIAPSSLLKRNP